MLQIKLKKITVALLILSCVYVARAHHSYVMFDGSTIRTVTGIVAKLEWMNPHVYLWIYVPSATDPGQHELYAFENGSPNAITKVGWRKDSLKINEKITVEYWPLRDGRNGGHLATVTLSDGRKLQSVGAIGR